MSDFYVKDILILGGTGAIGSACLDILSEMQLQATVTSRAKRKSYGTINFIQGNAKDHFFFSSIISSKKWDAVIDFMTYSTEEFEGRVDQLLNNTKQYVFLSSARVYADSGGIIKEDALRYLDLEEKNETLDCASYPIIKARCEDILQSSPYKNWTIIRPGTTYNVERLDFANLRKEEWLYRAIIGKSIVVSKDLLEIRFTNTWGGDVAKGIISILGKESAMRDIFHITENRTYTWKEILELYLNTLREHRINPRVVIRDICPIIRLPNKMEQYKNYMCFDHIFDNTKINNFCAVNEFLDAKKGLIDCLNAFLDKPSWKEINWEIEGILDSVSHDKTRFRDIGGVKNKIIYFCYRYHFSWVFDIYKWLKIKIVFFR